MKRATSRVVGSYRRQMCWLCSTALLMACPRLKQTTEGESGAESGNGADAGTREVRPLDELSSSELSNLCADLNERMRELFSNRELVTFDCTRIFIDTGDSLSCSQAVAECVLEAPEASSTAPRPPDFEIDGTECNAIGACPVNTDEFEACIEDRFEQSDRLISRMSCNIAGNPEAIDDVTRELQQPRPIPLSCRGVAARCASLL